MLYKEVLEFLFSQLPMYQRTGKVAYKANLDNTHQLDDYFEHPHTSYKTIHIAGTNGKGSVSHALSSILQEAGYSVGLYTSPHLKDFRERIKINGICIPEKEVIDFIEKHQSFIQQLKPSFFEMTVAMAFQYFKKKMVDVAIIEVGLGGRLDSTNIINPECSVITNIGLDHVALLGDTIEKIAREKGGIIKPETPVIIGESNSLTESIFTEIAHENNAPIYFSDKDYSIPVAMNGIDGTQIFQVYKDKHLHYADLKLDLLGMYQQKNIKTVLKAIDVLMEKNFNIQTSHLYEGIGNVVKNTGLMGRWQILDANPAIICDTGHNQEGVQELVKQIAQTPYKSLHMVWGMVNDKDLNSILPLLPKQAQYYFAKPNIPRGLDAQILKMEAEKIGLSGETYPSIADALKKAKKNSSPNDLIFIGGSTFVVAEVI
ncbi:bifunctional folylpolyglutamate synthase/dihydrofolate synthase [Saccharicrinis fermentans]|uniref:Dihydrofolate synthase/folylpolyglutamate synthase n=1 Tax=Saccharicrinis fermentans DSM 9555 = JCM 21142 TaxID=869213 RepID=W7YB34_9BACT|nr:folylpolyglutamate synthase/dihydrofolate synthase family protein [Saccharicrinis fermentans]GAF05622.1 folylpolyglutamate synthase [Saccharicrinis fermentans DSM 9555 = JCM 21142]